MLTQEQTEYVMKVLNEAADDVIDAAALPDEGARDALNLVVNIVGTRLRDNATATVEEVIVTSYTDYEDDDEALVAKVLRWCAS